MHRESLGLRLEPTALILTTADTEENSLHKSWYIFSSKYISFTYSKQQKLMSTLSCICLFFSLSQTVARWPVHVTPLRSSLYQWWNNGSDESLASWFITVTESHMLSSDLMYILSDCCESQSLLSPSKGHKQSYLRVLCRTVWVLATASQCSCVCVCVYNQLPRCMRCST